jgi:hypothetical protein
MVHKGKAIETNGCKLLPNKFKHVGVEFQTSEAYSNLDLTNVKIAYTCINNPEKKV